MRSQFLALLSLALALGTATPARGAALPPATDAGTAAPKPGAWKLDLSMIAPRDQKRVGKLLTAAGYDVEAIALTGMVTLRKVDLEKTVRRLLSKLYKPDTSMDGSRSAVKNAYFARVVLCLPRFLPTWNRHDGYYTGSEADGCANDPAASAFALLVHHVDRSPENLQALWAASKPIVFSAVDPERYTSSDLGKTVDALLDTRRRLDMVPRVDELLAYAHERVLSVHDDQARRNAAYGWPWRDVYPFTIAFADSAIDPLWQTSFWVRRHEEGNARVVQEILQEIAAHYGAK